MRFSNRSHRCGRHDHVADPVVPEEQQPLRAVRPVGFGHTGCTHQPGQAAYPEAAPVAFQLLQHAGNLIQGQPTSSRRIVSKHGCLVISFHRLLDPAATPPTYPIVRFPVTRLIRFSALALLISGSTLSFAQDTPKPKPLTPIAKSTNSIRIPYEKFTLPNGLTVVMSQD